MPRKTKRNNGSVLNPRKLLERMRKLASDPENHQTIATDETTMPFLLHVLKNQFSDEFILITLHTLYYISCTPSCRDSMLGLSGILALLAEFSDNSNENIAHFASEILTNLSSQVNRQEENETLRRELHSIDLIVSKDQCECFERVVDRIEGVLLGVEGVVSVTTNRVKLRITVYTAVKESRERLMDALEELGLKFPRVNAFSAFSAGIGGFKPTMTSVKSPMYLSPTEMLFVGKASLISKSNSNFQYLSLAARLQKQKEEEKKRVEKQNSVSRLVGKLGGIFW